MAVNYDLYKIKDLGNTEDQGMLRARFVSKGTVSTERLIKWVQQTSSFNHGQVRGVINSLCEGILQHLENGNEVHLDGLGYFSLSLDSRPVEDRKDIRAESVGFKKLIFKAAKSVRKRLAGIVVQRVTYPTAPLGELNLEKKVALLREFLTGHPCITRADYARITFTRKSTAVNDLNEFIRQGWLRKYGSGRTIVYLLNKTE